MAADKAKRRRLRITELVMRGQTAPSVAKKYSVSAQRITQICLETVGDLSKDYDLIPLEAANGIKQAREHQYMILLAIKHKRLKV